VNRPKILKLNKSLVHLSTTIQAREMQYQSESKTPIRLHINSYGGSVFAGLAAVDYIKKSKVPVETVIDGCAASAATLMSVVGTKRLMHENACMLVHQLSGHMWGKFQEMKDDMINSEMLMKKIKNIYRQHTKIPEEKLEEILNHDLWWDAEQCLEYGMVDEVI
jgi:ATP-dependent Clp endopeptidase proteolytic subunit ClpP